MAFDELSGHICRGTWPCAQTWRGLLIHSRLTVSFMAGVVWLALYLAHFRLIWLYAVDVPYWDEWDIAKRLHIYSDQPLFPFNWLFLFHNRHRFVTVRAMILALYFLNGWNIAVHQVLNFMIFGGLLLFIVAFAKKFVPHLPSWIVLGFTLFLLSPVNYENHFMALQTNVHFVLLFFLGAVYFLFQEGAGNASRHEMQQEPPAQNNRQLLGGVALAISAIYSNAGGVAACSVLVVGFALFKWQRQYSFHTRGLDVRARREKLQLIGVVLPTLLALGIWFIGYFDAPKGVFAESPARLAFWQYFLNLLSLGFGITQVTASWGLLCLSFTATPLIALWWRARHKNASPASQIMSGNITAVVVATLGIFSILLLIAMGRAGIGIEQSKSPRYAEFGMMLIPLSVMLWSLALHDSARLRNLAWVFLGIFCAFSFSADWQQFSYYRREHDRRVNALTGIRRYYEKGGATDFPALYPKPLSSHLRAAKPLDFSFFRTMRLP